jgi:hypothetical protein
MTAKLADIKDCPDWPRWLSAEQSAAYVGVSLNLFNEEVESGKWPRPTPRGSKGSRLTWDRNLLDEASDRVSGNEVKPAKPGAAALRLLGS